MSWLHQYTYTAAMAQSTLEVKKESRHSCEVRTTTTKLAVPNQ